MARKPMVTRSFKAVDCNVLCLNIETKETVEKSITLYGHYPTEDKLRKAVKKKLETPSIRVVEISTSDTYEQLLGQDEEKFIENAEILPPRTTNIWPEKENKK